MKRTQKLMQEIHTEIMELKCQLLKEQAEQTKVYKSNNPGANMTDSNTKRLLQMYATNINILNLKISSLRNVLYAYKLQEVS